MGGKKKHPIRLKQERVLLGDVLPYETPVFFSNRHFYEFVVENDITSNGKRINYKGGNESIEKVVNWLNNSDTIPFSYKIARKESDFRELAVIHPGNQLHVVSFYSKFQHLILYYSSLSNYSIRKPHKVSTLTALTSGKGFKLKVEDGEHEIIEEFGKEYKSLKTYFAYQYYSNIHKFFESYSFHQAEKKFKKLVKFDISKCFDSIYTHSITWALADKQVVKEYLPIARDYSFGGAFDTLMQKLNYNETNGIVIGPEFSRIFAEIILQKVDHNVEQSLIESNQLKSKVDYEIFRYVDDYFLFCSSDTKISQIMEEFRVQLKKFKLDINDSKTETYEKPIITQLTIAKIKISQLLDKTIRFNLESETDEEAEEGSTDDLVPPRYSIYVSSNRTITRFKTILKETDVPYKNILNFTFAVIERRLVSLLKNFIQYVNKHPETKRKAESKLTEALLEVLDFGFFLYSVSPRVNTTLKLSSCVVKIIKFANTDSYIGFESKHRLFKKIFDEINQVLSKQKNNKHAQIEYLFLLIILSELGKEYRLTESTLSKYFSIEKIGGHQFKVDYELNYWSIMILMFYMKNIKRYEHLRTFLLEEVVLAKFNAVKKEKRSRNTELTLLLLDFISCPFVDVSFKRKLLHLFGVHLIDDRDKIISLRRYWFIKWTDFDLEKELSTKRSREVY